MAWMTAGATLARRIDHTECGMVRAAAGRARESASHDSHGSARSTQVIDLDQRVLRSLHSIRASCSGARGRRGVIPALPSAAGAIDFSYSGFGTLGYAQTDTDLAQVSYSGQPEGIDEDGTFEFDSKLGLQATARFNDMFFATVTITSL